MCCVLQPCDSDPLTSDFIPMSSTCQILYVPASLTWRCPTFHSSPAVVPVKHTLSTRSLDFSCPGIPCGIHFSCGIHQTSAPATSCPQERNWLLCRCQKCLFPLCKVVQLEKLVFLQLYPLTGEIRSLSLFHATSKAVNQPVTVVRNRDGLFGPKEHEERSLQSGDRLFSKVGPAEMMLSSYCDFSTSLSPKSTPKPKRGKCHGPPGYQRSPPGPEQGSVSPCLKWQLDTPSRRGSLCFRSTLLSHCHHQRGQGAQAAPWSSAPWQRMWAANQKLLPPTAGQDLFRGEVVDFPRSTLFLLHRKAAPPRDEGVQSCHCNAHLQVFYNTTILFCMCVWHCLLFVCLFTFELCNGWVASLASGNICAYCLFTAF